MCGGDLDSSRGDLARATSGTYQRRRYYEKCTVTIETAHDIIIFGQVNVFVTSSSQLFPELSGRNLPSLQRQRHEAFR